MPFTLNDFADALQQMQKQFDLRDVLRTSPGYEHVDFDPNTDARRDVAMIQSMTTDEREFPEQIIRIELDGLLPAAGPSLKMSTTSSASS